MVVAGVATVGALLLCVTEYGSNTNSQNFLQIVDTIDPHYTQFMAVHGKSY